tara:strand:- start:2306 stop:2767 length:462 start_codon:yes stop_codon:yes gene_type:complete
MEMFMDILLNSGPMGVIAGYMMYWVKKQESKNDKLTQHYIQKIEELQNKDEIAREALLMKFEEREEKLREKYDSVIDKIDEERKQQDLTTSRSLEKANDKLDIISQRVDGMGIRFDDVSSKIMDLNNRLGQQEQQVQRMYGMLDGIKSALALR